MLLALKLRNALVEFVISDGAELQAHQAEGLDGRLVMEERGQGRARADQVAGRDKDVVGMPCFQILDQGRHLLDATGLNRGRLAWILGVGQLEA